MALVLGGCGDDSGTSDASGDTGPTTPPSTLTEVEEQIFALSCAFSSCHSGANGASGLNLEGKTHARLVDVDANDAPGKKLVVAGDPESSYLFEKCQADPAVGDAMPLGGGTGLDAERLEMLRSWILAGAEDN